MSLGGPRGAHVGWTAREQKYVSLGMPGTGLSWREYAKRGKAHAPGLPSAPCELCGPGDGHVPGWVVWAAVAAAAGVWWLWRADPQEAEEVMNIRIVNYAASASPLVQAFVDVEIDGWLRFNGLNFLRAGGLGPARLRAWGDGKRLYRDAVEILDADLAKQLTADILAAIEAHVALLPVERRARPPVEPPPREPKSSVAAAAGKASPSPGPPGGKPLPPPERLLARAGRVVPRKR